MAFACLFAAASDRKTGQQADRRGDGHSAPWILIDVIVCIGDQLLAAGNGAGLNRLGARGGIFQQAHGLGAQVVGLGRGCRGGLLTEAARVALLISLFTVGLKLRASLRDRIWLIPLRLGVIGMIVTIALVTAGSFYFLHLPLGAAVLLGAILAPTDPVLASDVQIKDVGDRDQFRFGLTGEGGLNDGTAYPFVILGLALLGVQEAKIFEGLDGALNLMWVVTSAPLLGWFLGWSVGNGVVYLRKRYRLAFGMEEFLGIGLIALSYGLAEAMHGMGFLAVFAAGVGMRRMEGASSDRKNGSAGDGPSPALVKMSGDAETVAGSDDHATAYMAATVLDFNQQIEHFAEFLTVLLLGILVSHSGFSWEGLAVALALFCIVRPASVLVALAGAGVPRLQRNLIGWFGIRGIGSLYYLLFALQYPWRFPLASRMTVIVMTVLTLSVMLHGVSSTPLMAMYHRRRSAQR